MDHTVQAAFFCPLCRATYEDLGGGFCPTDGARLRPIEELGASWVGRLLADKYRVVRLVGSGGTAEVYEAEDTTNGRRVALKLLNSRTAASATNVERFKREARMISLIDHPNVVSLQDFGALPDGTYFMAMELLRGRSLAEALDDGHVDVPLAFEVAVQVCDGLAAAHDKNIVHRDVKPGNVFLVPTNEGPGRVHVKILDLGIAKLQGTEALSNLTQTGTVFGTPEYMSPEQVMGEQATPASDVYALGVVIYKMLLGDVPFSAGSFVGILTKHLTTPPAWRRDIAQQRGVPPQAEAVVLKALSKNPAHRYATMREFQAVIAGLGRAAAAARSKAPTPDAQQRVTVRPPARKRAASTVVQVPLASANATDREVVEIAPDVFWVGRRQGVLLECNTYLRVFRGNGLQLALVIDPGPPKDLDTIAAKVSGVIGSLDRVDLIFLNHQDPDVSSNASAIQGLNPRAHVLCSEDTWRLAQFYGLSQVGYSAIERFPKLQTRLATGHLVSFVPTPFCHFRGAVMLYDHESRVLFSGDLFGGLSRSTSLIANDDSWPDVAVFHQLYMASNKALRMAIRRIRRLDRKPRIIAPQHGGIVVGDRIAPLLKRMQRLKVGVDLLVDEGDKQTAVDALNDVLTKLSACLGSDVVSGLLRCFTADGSFPNLFVLEGDTIVDFKIEPRAAIRALERDAIAAASPRCVGEVRQLFGSVRRRIRVKSKHGVGGDESVAEIDD
jgi:eukaryotic-like serine/threonine-protein kinase